MPEKTKSRRGGKKHRKWGRNLRKPGSSQQQKRTEANKAHRLMFEELKAGRELAWPNISEGVMAVLTTLRRRWKDSKPVEA